MNFFLFSATTFLIPFANGWGWPRTQTSEGDQCSAGSGSSEADGSGSAGSCQGSSGSSGGSTGSMQPCPKQMWNISSPALNESVCWDSMLYQSLNLTNVTAIFQPGSWESEYQKIQDFCSARGNGSFCYQPSSSSSPGSSADACLSMAVVRCPEGMVSSCRAGFVCGEIYADQNVTCTWKNMSQWQTSMNETSATNQPMNQSCSSNKYYNVSLFNFTESGQAACLSIADVLKLPEPVNVTTTIDAQNNTITVGKQAFGYPFATSTTVDCTMTCLSSLPSGLPQPTGTSQVCFNPTLQYDQLIPKSTCAGPYPPGPMTTVTVCPTERTGSAGGAGMSTTEQQSSSTMSSSSSSACESSSSATMMPTMSSSSTVCPTSELSQASSESAAPSMTTTQVPSVMYNDYGYGQGQEQGQGQGNDYGNKDQYSKDQYGNSNDYNDDGYYGGQGDHDYSKQYQ